MKGLKMSLNKYLVLSDIHLGHNTNKTKNISNNLKSFLNYYEEELKGLEVLFIAGDTFDCCLSTYQSDFIDAIETLTYILNWCNDKKCKLRILEGTPSHDWKQVNVVYEIMDKLDLKEKIDFKYVDTLAVENLNGKNVLYIPDEYRETAEETYNEIEKLLIKLKLQEVDIVVMHGQFHYQIPLGLKTSHDEDKFLKLCKEYIHIGHIHTHSHYQRIVAQGSFDRLAHNEEEAKGGVLVSDGKWKFLENINSMLFLTYDFRFLDDTGIMKELNLIKNTIKKDSAIRFIVANKEHFLNMDKNIKLILSQYKVKIQVNDPLSIKSLNKEENIVKKEQIKSFEIRKDNILELIRNEFESEINANEIDSKDVSRMLDKLSKII